MAFKMKGKSMTQGTSAYKKALVGKQGNLPEELKSKIEAAPTKMYGKTPAKFSQPGAGGPGGDDPKTAAAKAQGREVGEMNKSSKFHPDNVGRKRGAESGFKATYKEAYKDADKKKYKTFDEFKTAAERYNRGRYGTTEPTKAVKEVNEVTGGKTTKKDLAKAKTKVDQTKPEDRILKTSTPSFTTKTESKLTPKKDERTRRQKRQVKRSNKAFEKSLTAEGKRKLRLEGKATKLRNKSKKA